jgi:uncharacterized membrane protein
MSRFTRLDTDYDIVTLDLGTARDKVALGVKFQRIRVLSYDGSGVTIRLTADTNDAILLSSTFELDNFAAPESYITNTAQTGKTLVLLLTREEI